MTDRKSSPKLKPEADKHPFGKFIKSKKTTGKSSREASFSSTGKGRDWHEGGGRNEQARKGKAWTESDRKEKRHRGKDGENADREEVTFSKTLEDKWATTPVPSRKPSEKKDGKSRTLKPRIKERYVKENSFEKAYDSAGRKKFTQGKPEENALPAIASGEEMPLNKFIAHCGICSRRDAVNLIKDGKVKVNDAEVLEPGYKVQDTDKVTLQGKELQLQHNLVYILLNKPKGYITTTDDPKGRRTVMDLVANGIEERVFPIGRLDRNTTGLLLLTNDGQLAQQLAHPKYEIRKVYMVTLDKQVTQAHFQAILKGLVLEDGPAPVDELEYLERKNEIGIQIHNGKNRIVRRIFESLGYVVEKLDRVVYAGLTKKNLPRGKWRFLSQQEIINLKHLSR